MHTYTYAKTRTWCPGQLTTIVEPYQQVLVISVLNKGEEAIVLPVLPHHHVEVHTVRHSSLPAIDTVIS